MQGQIEDPCHIRNEHVAGGEAKGDRGLGRRRSPRQGLAPLRGSGRGHHHQRQGSRQVRHAGQAGGGGRIRLGVL